MKGQPEYYTEVKVKKHDYKVIIFCIIIGIISVAIVAITGFMTYNKIDSGKEKDIAKEGVTKTTGKTNIHNQVQEDVAKNDKQEKKEEEKPKKFVFPKHDFAKALESELPQYSEEIDKKVVGVYSSNEKQIFLTFDDGPSNITPKILDILKENDVKATFFVLGSNVDLKPEIVKRAYDEGHFIANHGYSHVYKSIYQSTQSVLDEYNHTTDSVRKAIGVPNYNSHLFRFPGGSSGGPYNDVKQQAIGLLAENQITFTNWNCLTGDSAGNTTKEAMWNELISTAGTKTSLVILMHDAGDKQVTAELLPEIIKYYKDNGYVFRSYYDIMKN